MRWWQKKVRGWIVPFWSTNTPLVSKRFSKLEEKEKEEVVEKIGDDFYEKRVVRTGGGLIVYKLYKVNKE